MIKPNELRIGNWVGDGIIEFKVKGFYSHPQRNETEGVIYSINPPINFSFSAIEPIPLTEEWLKKFGFHSCYNGWSDWYNKGEFVIRSIDEDKWAALISKSCDAGECQFEHEVLNDQIKHVHQLQNLYWCLCGEELTDVFALKNK